MATNSPKYRDFFITINKETKCYKDALEIVKELNFKLYALILHDKDTLVDEDGTLKPKSEHKHLMFELKNPVSFNKMQERFKGAHIIVPKYKKSAYQYLVHNSPNSKGEKYQYSLDEIITNDIQQIEYIIKTEDSELFRQNKFLVYIAEGTRTAYQFVKRFGLDAYKQYWKPYEDMLRNLDSDEEMQQDLQALINKIDDDDLPFQEEQE